MNSRQKNGPQSVGTRWRTLGDAAVAALFVLLLWAPGLVTAQGATLWVGVATAAVVLVFVPLRWRHPLLAPVAIATANVVAIFFGATVDVGIAAAWALFPLALRRGTWHRWMIWFLFATILATVLGAVPLGGTTGLVAHRLVVGATILAGSWMLGSMVKAHSDAVAAEAVAEAQRASAEEQLQIARDVHDVVGHTLGVIGMEAGVARMNPDASAEQLRETLADVENSARESLQQVQALLRTVRGRATTADSAGAPPPGLDELPALVERTRAAGVPVDLDLDPGLHPDEATQLAIYRIVQEGLANVVKHAPGASVRVSVRRDGDEIRVRVHNDGDTGTERPTTANAGAGNGLIGIRERARLLGGRADAGQTPDGGFEVNAWLPPAPVETTVRP